jgi:hypothetical protein
MIVKLAPHKWVLFSRDGKKVLGTHRTKHDAKAQEYAVNIAKARRAGHRIPRPR